MLYFFWYFLLFLALVMPFWQFLCLFVFLKFLAFFVQHISIFFVAVTHCDKQKIHLSQ